MADGNSLGLAAMAGLIGWVVADGLQLWLDIAIAEERLV